MCFEGFCRRGFAAYTELGYSCVCNTDLLLRAFGAIKDFFGPNESIVSKRKCKRVYLLASAEDTEESAFDGAIKGIQGWIDCFEGVRLAGVVKGAGVESVGEIRNTRFPQEAYEMGKAL